MGWLHILKGAGTSAVEDDLLTWAAALAYYFLFSLFPAVLLFAALLHTLQLQVLTANFVAALSRNLPRPAAELVSTQLTSLLHHHVPGLLSLDIILLFYAASAGFSGMMTALNAAYDVPEGRSFAHRTWLQFALTISAGLLVTLALSVVLGGHHLLIILAGPVHLSHALALFWPVIRWGVTIGFMFLALWLLYRFTPNVAPHGKGSLPAVGAAVIVWIIASAGLSVYIDNFGNYSAVYGSLGAVIGLMIWFYLIALAILFGAEVHAHWLRQRLGVIPAPRNPPREKPVS